MTEGAKDGQPDSILVVDDDVIVRMNISDYLRRCGYRVIEAASVAEAQTVLEQGVKIGLVFADLHVNSEDTFALAQWVRQKHSGLDVILVATPKGAAKAAAEVCEDGPLSRPFEPETLLRRIRQLKAARRAEMPNKGDA